MTGGRRRCRLRRLRRAACLPARRQCLLLFTVSAHCQSVIVQSGVDVVVSSRLVSSRLALRCVASRRVVAFSVCALCPVPPSLLLCSDVVVVAAASAAAVFVLDRRRSCDPAMLPVGDTLSLFVMRGSVRDASPRGSVARGRSCADRVAGLGVDGKCICWQITALSVRRRLGRTRCQRREKMSHDECVTDTQSRGTRLLFSIDCCPTSSPLCDWTRQLGLANAATRTSQAVRTASLIPHTQRRCVLERPYQTKFFITTVELAQQF